MPRRVTRRKKVATEAIKDDEVRLAIDQLEREIENLRLELRQRVFIAGGTVQTYTVTAGAGETFPPHLQLTVKSYGKPFRVRIDEGFPPSSLANSILMQLGGAAGFLTNINWYRDGDLIRAYRLGCTDDGADVPPLVSLPPSILGITEDLPAGLYRYRVGITAVGGNFVLGSTRLLAYGVD